MADCERSCETRRYPCDPANPYCVNKCYCNSGFIRSGKAGGACVPYDQCPASDVVGRRDDLILPLDPRHLSTEIEADSDNSTVTLNRVTKDSGSKNDTVLDDHKVSKRDVANENTKQAEGEGVSVTFFSIIIHL